MPEIPDVVAGEPVASSWGNAIRNRTAQRYASAAARDASIPVPTTGDLAVLEDTGDLTMFDGSTWQTYRELSNRTGLVRVFNLRTVSVAVTQGATAILDVDISDAGLTDLSKTNINIVGSAANAQSTQRFWTIWSVSLTDLSLRNSPGQTNPAGGTAFGRLAITEYW
jgi:hypothetical protein